MSKDSKLILVTGGTGYIGSHTAVALQERGYDVVIIDNLSNSRIEVLDGIENITGKKPAFRNFDLCDKKTLYTFFTEFGNIEAIIHFAALKAVGESVEIPLEYYHNNMESLVNLLMAMRDFGTKYFVFSSSCTVYGQPDKLPVTEDAPIKKAFSPYGNTKQISEEIIQDAIAATKNIQAISLRYFNPIGAHPSAHIGELPLGNPLNLVPIITQTVARVRNKLKVFGNDYNTSDGTAIRDYINVNDLAMAHVAAVDRMLGNKNENRFEVYNLGTGTGLSVLEIINTFEKVTGEKVNYEIVDRRPGDVEKVWADTTLANEKLNWKSETPLENTLISAWKWEKKIRNIK
jgi:UDP-glucose 4-epimerase